MDPYAVLGVDRTASEGEIREAYLRQSKRLHPDQHAEASPEVRAAATEAMQDLNVAYDTLRRHEAAPTQPPRANEPTTSARREPSRPSPPPPTYRPTPTRRSRRWITIGLALVVGLALLAMLTVEPFDPTQPPPPDRSVNLATLQGRCLTLDVTGELEDVVDCTRPHDARVVAVVDRGAPCPVWAEASMAGPTKNLCLDRT